MLQAVINKIHWCVAVCTVNCNCCSHSSSHWSDSQIMQRLRIAFLSTLPALFRQNIAITCGMEKLEWCGYSTVKKNWRYIYSFRRSPPNVTDGRTDSARRQAALMHSIARKKNWTWTDRPWYNPADQWVDFLVWDRGRLSRANEDTRMPTLFVQRRISREAHYQTTRTHTNTCLNCELSVCYILQNSRS